MIFIYKSEDIHFFFMKPGVTSFSSYIEKWFYAVPQDKNENKCKKVDKRQKKTVEKIVEGC